MLPKIKNTKKDIDTFLFAGIDLFEVNENEVERFIPFSQIINDKIINDYYLLFWNEQVLDDLLNEDRFYNYYQKMNFDIDTDNKEYAKLVGLNNTNIKETLSIILNELNTIIN